jgi:two-component system, LytTR family, response regulator
MITDNSGMGHLTCIIVDDEERAAGELEQLLGFYPLIRVIMKISDPRHAVSSILETRPDLVFLDIQMPGMNGFEVIEGLNRLMVKPMVIFVTGFDQYAIRAIRSSAFDYLLKPLDKGELALAMERVMTRYKQKELEINYAALLERTSGKKIRFNTTGGFILVDPHQIIYIQADWNYSEVYLSREKREVVALNLGTIEELLPKGFFARINRSVIINLTYLEKVQRVKRLCQLRKDGENFEFKIPILRIRYLEKLL